MMSRQADQNSSNSVEQTVVVNGSKVRVSGQTTIAQLLESLEMGRAVAVEVDGILIPRENHQSSVLEADSSVEIVSLAGGG